MASLLSSLQRLHSQAKALGAAQRQSTLQRCAQERSLAYLTFEAVCPHDHRVHDLI